MDSSYVQDPAERAIAIFKFLTSARFTDKYTAIEWLDASSTEIDRPLLRSLIVKALRHDYSVETETVYDDRMIGDTRSWLLSALGRIAADDAEVIEEIASHVNIQTEPREWVRYWALEGLISGNNKKALEIARTASQNVEDHLVSYLAFAYLAANGDRQAQEQIKKGLADQSHLRFVLRALRVVQLPFTVQILCDLVERGEYTDATYDAIVALGRLPSTYSQVTDASRALGTAIGKMRGRPWHDGMRTAAITALGNLKVEYSGPLLLEELIDYNPAVVREAARSIQNILGLAATVTRVVETVIKNRTPTTIDAFARALRWMNRDAVAEELENLMGSGSVAQQEVSRLLLSELGGVAAYEKLRARTAAMKQYGDVLERAENRVQALFEQTVHEAQKGFQLASWMDMIVFSIGIVLVLMSAFTALFDTGDIATWAGVGSAGVLGVLYTLLISNPRRQVREAVDHLMRVKIIFLAYLRRLHQSDQAYTRLLLDNEKISAEQLKDFSNLIGVIMEGTAKQLAEAIPEKASRS